MGKGWECLKFFSGNDSPWSRSDDDANAADADVCLQRSTVI